MSINFHFATLPAVLDYKLSFYYLHCLHNTWLLHDNVHAKHSYLCNLFVHSGSATCSLQTPNIYVTLPEPVWHNCQCQNLFCFQKYISYSYYLQNSYLSEHVYCQLPFKVTTQQLNVVAASALQITLILWVETTSKLITAKRIHQSVWNLLFCPLYVFIFPPSSNIFFNADAHQSSITLYSSYKVPFPLVFPSEKVPSCNKTVTGHAGLLQPHHKDYPS